MPTHKTTHPQAVRVRRNRRIALWPTLVYHIAQLGLVGVTTAGLVWVVCA